MCCVYDVHLGKKVKISFSVISIHGNRTGDRLAREREDSLLQYFKIM